MTNGTAQVDIVSALPEEDRCETSSPTLREVSSSQRVEPRSPASSVPVNRGSRPPL